MHTPFQIVSDGAGHYGEARTSPRPRYAVYYDASGSELARLGAAWLGRDATRRDAPASALAQPVPRGLTAERFHELTAEPRRYGFHATLKAPMRLAAGTDVDRLRAAAAEVAARHAPFSLEPMTVAKLGSFLALRPRDDSAALGALADDCVMALDVLRAPPNAGNPPRRHAAVLSPRQTQMLARWGYPYVLREYRFHVTLTGSLGSLNASEAMMVEQAARRHFAPALTGGVRFDAIALFEERAPGDPLWRIASFPLGGA
jgi:hypothetical protein